MIPADKQTAFNRAWNEIERPAWDPCSGACKYLAEDGAKCAIGLFVPDGHPAQAFSGDVRDLHYVDPGLFEEGFDMHFLRRLQACHDGSTGGAFLADFRASMRTLAKDYGLTIPGEVTDGAQK